MQEQVLWWATNGLNDVVEEREEKWAVSFDTRSKKFCVIDKWAIY